MRTSYQTTNGTNLNYNAPPMRLWQKAKKYGIWNPNDIDFSQDYIDWRNFSEEERAITMRTLVQFQTGEEAVTLDLLPLIMAISKEGRLEEEIFLTSFLWEEAKHVDGFNRFFREVIKEEGDLSHHIKMIPSYGVLFNEMLPTAMNILITDPSPVNMARASVTYNMIVESVLAETGYYSFYMTLSDLGVMPGLQEFIGKLKQDESRHIAYGIFLLSRLIAEYGDPVWEAIQDQMNTLMIPAMSIVTETFAGFDPIPFGQDPNTYTQYALEQFNKRWKRLERARTQSLAEVYGEELESV